MNQIVVCGSTIQLASSNVMSLYITILSDLKRMVRVCLTNRFHFSFYVFLRVLLFSTAVVVGRQPSVMLNFNIHIFRTVQYRFIGGLE